MVTVFNLRMRRRSSIAPVDEAAATPPRVPTIHPLSTPLRLWPITLTFVILYQMIYIPFNMGFNLNLDGTVWQVVDRVMDVLFVLDILVNFNVAFYESFPADDQRHLLLRYSTDRASKDKFLVHSHARIASHYNRGWLWLDLLAAFPVDVIGNKTDGRDVNYLGMIRILRIPRLAGIFRVLKFLKNAGGFMWWFQYSKGSIVMRLLRLIAVTIYIVHVMACSWYPVGSWPGGWGDSNFVPNDMYKNYVRSYYAMMMVVMGQDILPVYEYEMAYLSMASIVGAVVIATVFGNVSILVESLTSDSDTYHDKMEDVYESMQELGLPHELQQRVHLYYTYLWQQYHSLDGKPAQCVSELSTNMQREIMLYLNARMIRSVPMMQECSPEVVQEIVLSLETRIYMPEDYIVSAGEMGVEMFFIQRGECEVIIAKDKACDAARPVEKTKRISAGDYFGRSLLEMETAVA